MLVERIMTSPCIMIEEHASIQKALELMTQEDIRHLPIVGENNELLGIVSDKDINRAMPSILNKDIEINLNVPIKTIMNKKVITCHMLDFVEDIAVDFYDEGIGSIPVISNGACVGIVTQKDMLNTFLELTGVTVPGSAIEVQVPDVAGIMHEVTTVFHQHKVSIESILVYRDKEQSGFKLVLIRMRIMNPNKIINALNKAGFKVRLPLEY